MDTPWRIELFGWLRATQGDHVVSRFRSQKIRSLLAFLAYYNQRSHPRDALIELLWPECDPSVGRHRLRQALCLLRRQLEPPGVPAGSVILADHTSIQLNPAACLTDAAEYEAALEAAARTGNSTVKAQSLTEAVELYRGALLPGCFEEWVLPERQRLADAYVQALDQLAGLVQQTGDLQQVLQYAHRAIASDPTGEEAHRTLIRLLVAAGQPEAALRQYHELERLMDRDLGMTPAPETRALVVGILTGETAGPPSAGSVASCAGRRAPEQRVAAGDRTYLFQPGPSPPGPGHSPFQNSTGAREGRLPPQLTRFFGREPEIARLCELIGEGVGRRVSGVEDGPIRPDTRHPDPDIRLLTLTGPGGSGKTRLAIQVARQLRPAFPGGAWFVPLQDLVDPGMISDQILGSLRLPRSSDVDALEQVRAFLSSRSSLLLLDNFEQLVEGGAEIVKLLLEQSETLTLLVTSRQPLNLPGEREFPVPSLPVPVPNARCPLPGGPAPSLSDEHWASSTIPSVALFVNRAQAARPDFQLTKANAAAIAALCARLEGLPLAIELAAARVGMLTPAQMLARLEPTLPVGAGGPGTHEVGGRGPGPVPGRFELLVSRQRGVDARHRSLRAALDWSYRLLSPDLQRFFSRLSVFRGGFTLEAAAAVCFDLVPGLDPPASPVESSKALEFLSRLRESSLLLAEESEGEMRYRLLESVREYGRDQLHEAGETALWLGRHRDFFLAFAERAGSELGGSRQAEWADRLETEHHNLRAALEWSQWEESGSDAAFRLGVVLARFWAFRCSLNEGRQRLGPLLAVIGTRAPTAAQARLLHEVGVFARWQGDYEAARGLLLQSLAIGRELEDPRCISDALRTLGGATKCLCEALCTLEGVSKLRGDYSAARDLLTESLEVARKADYLNGVAGSLEELGSLALLEGRVSDGYSLSMESLAIGRPLGNQRLIANSLKTLGGLSSFSGDFVQARAFFEEALAIYQRLGSRKGAGYASGSLGLIALVEGDLEAARSFIREALTLHGEIDDKAGVATSLEELAALAARQQRPQRSAYFFGAAAGVWDAIGAASGAATRVEYRRQVAACRESLGAARDGEAAWPGPRFAPAWVRGRALPLERALAEALEETRVPPAA